jgi:hypothetical protein
MFRRSNTAHKKSENHAAVKIVRPRLPWFVGSMKKWLNNATFYTEGFSSFVASAAASIATGWSEPVPGRV